MTSIWANDGAAWRLLAPVGFPDEATLHGLVEEAPQLLPLSGSPRLVVLGREVLLGSGYADLLAVEPSGRFVLIEVKLAGNPEARRAVVAQILAYEVQGARVLVPQRVEPERLTSQAAVRPPVPSKKRAYRIDAGEFERDIDRVPNNDDRVQLRRLLEWTRDLERAGLARVLAYRGTSGRTTLLPYLLNEDAGLVTVWNDGGFYIRLWRSVFTRRAPNSIERMEQLIAPVKLGAGNSVRDVSDELLSALARRVSRGEWVGAASGIRGSRG